MLPSQKINNTTIVNFETSVAVNVNRIKVKMCLCIPVISSKTCLSLSFLAVELFKQTLLIIYS